MWHEKLLIYCQTAIIIFKHFLVISKLTSLIESAMSNKDKLENRGFFFFPSGIFLKILDLNETLIIWIIWTQTRQERTKGDLEENIGPFHQEFSQADLFNG